MALLILGVGSLRLDLIAMYALPVKPIAKALAIGVSPYKVKKLAKSKGL
jgi:hypothetical protein